VARFLLVEEPVAEPNILMRERGGAPRAPGTASEWVLWRVFGWLGLAFLLVGAADLVLAWVPEAFGRPDWEFGTVVTTLQNIPVPAMGLALVMVWAVVEERLVVVRVAAVAFGLSALVILALAVLFATNVPIAMSSVTDPMAKLGLKKATARVAVQVVVYGAVFVVLAVAGWRGARARQT
jgi:hypothetical protein